MVGEGKWWKGEGMEIDEMIGYVLMGFGRGGFRESCSCRVGTIGRWVKMESDSLV